MKSVLLVMSILMLSVSSYGRSKNRNSQRDGSRKAHRQQVQSLAQEQGIDMQSREGRRQMAEYLKSSGQESLLPPKRKRRRARQNNESEGESSEGSDY